MTGLNYVVSLKQEGLSRQVDGIGMGLIRVETQIVKLEDKLESQIVKLEGKLESQNKDILNSIHMLSEKISNQTERVAKLEGRINRNED